MTFIILLLASFLVGSLIGTVGVGGILLIPALSSLAHIDVHVAMGTALFSFIFTGILGTWLYQRHGSIKWRITIPVCIGSLFFGYIGSLANALCSSGILDMLLGAIIIFAGIYALFPAKGGTIKNHKEDRKKLILLLSIGCFVGFCSGLTGVGGPVLSVPLMVIIGFAPLTAIATSQVIQITAAISGSVGNYLNGFIDINFVIYITIAELIGVALGAKIAHTISQSILKKVVSIVCIVVGSFIFLRSLI